MYYPYLTIKKTEVTQASGQLQSLYTFHHSMCIAIWIQGSETGSGVVSPGAREFLAAENWSNLGDKKSE